MRPAVPLEGQSDLGLRWGRHRPGALHLSPGPMGAVQPTDGGESKHVSRAATYRTLSFNIGRIYRIYRVYRIV